MLNWDKGKSEKAISSADYIQNMEKEMDIICGKILKQRISLIKYMNILKRMIDLYTHI